MLDLLRNLKKPKYEPLNRIEIIRQNILDNFEYLQSLQPRAEILPVLKSNAYGHGLKEISKILNQSSAQMLVVDSFPEARVIYKYFNGKVLILGEMARGSYKYCDLKRTEFCIYNLETLKYLASLDKKIKIHLFTNTGMNREGIQDLELFLSQAKDHLDKVEITGLCSHLASADEESDLNKEQADKFFENLNILNQHKIFPKWIHLGNSPGIFILKDERLTAFRAGIVLYGYNIFEKTHAKFESANKLKPALRVTSKIVSIQNLNPGDKVSYNEQFEAQNFGKTALMPFGYYEGLDRRLSNKAKFLIKTKKSFYAKIAGRVCMNLTCLETGEQPINIGDEVEIISENNDAKNSVENIARLMETIPYEVLVKLQGNIRRVIT